MGKYHIQTWHMQWHYMVLNWHTETSEFYVLYVKCVPKMFTFFACVYYGECRLPGSKINNTQYKYCMA